jgi:RNase P protein component
VCDVRESFLTHPNKPALFIPDKHFSDLGNDVLLQELLQHLETIGAYRGRRIA